MAATAASSVPLRAELTELGSQAFRLLPLLAKFLYQLCNASLQLPVLILKLGSSRYRIFRSALADLL